MLRNIHRQIQKTHRKIKKYVYSFSFPCTLIPDICFLISTLYIPSLQHHETAVHGLDSRETSQNSHTQEIRARYHLLYLQIQHYIQPRAYFRRIYMAHLRIYISRLVYREWLISGLHILRFFIVYSPGLQMYLPCPILHLSISHFC
jgi:hypothetical protein